MAITLIEVRTIRRGIKQYEILHLQNPVDPTPQDYTFICCAAVFIYAVVKARLVGHKQFTDNTTTRQYLTDGFKMLGLVHDASGQQPAGHITNFRTIGPFQDQRRALFDRLAPVLYGPVSAAGTPDMSRDEDEYEPYDGR
ncbi:hypothetical protein GGF32_007169 [Allomyces javanicus]|nr:hypothetical protein GGF32_007169 [Allomyces javanicus]